MCKKQILPDYLMALPEQSDLQRWQVMKAWFDETVSCIEQLRFESHEEAFGTKESGAWRHSGPEWPDPDAGIGSKGGDQTVINVKPWFQVPFSSEEDRQDLLELLDHFHRMKPRVEQGINERLTTPAFLSDWGLFNYVAGRICQSYVIGFTDIAGERRGSGRRQDLQKIWVAKSLLSLGFPKTQRKVAEGLVVDHIKRVVADGSVSEEFDVGWYERMLSRSGDKLRSTFSGNLSKAEILRLADRDTDLPALPCGTQ